MRRCNVSVTAHGLELQVVGFKTALWTGRVRHACMLQHDAQHAGPRGYPRTPRRRPFSARGHLLHPPPPAAVANVGIPGGGAPLARPPYPPLLPISNPRRGRRRRRRPTAGAVVTARSLPRAGAGRLRGNRNVYKTLR